MRVRRTTSSVVVTPYFRFLPIVAACYNETTRPALERFEQ